MLYRNVTGTHRLEPNVPAYVILTKLMSNLVRIILEL